MKTRELISEYIEQHDLCPGATTVDQWLEKEWLEVRLEDRIVRVLPLWPIKETFVKHDIHHALTGYPTTAQGEFELAAWELASGGCHLNILFWIDRILTIFLGVFIYPRAVFKAWSAGGAVKTCSARR
ncbi:MAG: hypothetical protein AB8B48_16710 [Pseudomonadales bacterium]